MNQKKKLQRKRKEENHPGKSMPPLKMTSQDQGKVGRGEMMIQRMNKEVVDPLEDLQHRRKSVMVSQPTR